MTQKKQGIGAKVRRVVFGAEKGDAEIAPLVATGKALREERVTRPREVEGVFSGIATSDGAGVKLTRVLTHELQERLDPFLMLDAFHNDDPDDYIAGFPDHPHRGFETVTYMIAGRLRHRDSAGNEGLLENGGVQWMTAGRGLVHSEMPEQEEGQMEGFQLWLNLPARDKMTAPGYRDLKGEDIPVFTTAHGAVVKLIAGESHGAVGGMVREVTEPLYADIELTSGSHFEHALPAAFNAFVYVYRGAAVIGGKQVKAGRMAILENGPTFDGIRIETGDEAARALLIAGRPLNEPIVQHGPFVMNTKEEIRAAIEDFHAGKFHAS